MKNIFKKVLCVAGSVWLGILAIMGIYHLVTSPMNGIQEVQASNPDSKVIPIYSGDKHFMVYKLESPEINSSRYDVLITYTLDGAVDTEIIYK